jgi:hypothetical protein
MSGNRDFEAISQLAAVLHPVMFAVIDSLPAYHRDLIVLEYGLPGFESKSTPRSFATESARRTAFYRALKAFQRRLEEGLLELSSAQPSEEWLTKAIRFIKGEEELSTLADEWPLPESIETITASQFDEKVAVALPVNRDLIRYFSRHPEMLHLIRPREFEALTAEVLSSFGYTVKLGPLGRDGGVDVYAERRTRLGVELVLVQCKLSHTGRKVGVPILKQLYAEVTDREATKGILVTNSFFTSCALDYIDVHRYRLEGADGERLATWLAGFCN